MMRYFEGCRTAEDVKARYRECAKKLHPDCGGNAADFRAMMEEYKVIFDRLKTVHVNQAGETYEKETDETPEAFADIINKVIHLDGVTVEIIGAWVWLTGATMLYKDDIKKAGFWWSKSKKAWYWNGSERKSRRRGRYSMKGLRNHWGSRTVEEEEQKRLA